MRVSKTLLSILSLAVILCGTLLTRDSASAHDDGTPVAAASESADVQFVVLRCPETVDVGGYSAGDFSANCVVPEAGFTVTIQSGDFAASATTDGSGLAYFSDVALGNYFVPEGTVAFFLDQASRDEFAVSEPGTTFIAMYLTTIVADAGGAAVGSGGEVPSSSEAPAPSDAPANEDAGGVAVNALPSTGTGSAPDTGSMLSIGIGALLAFAVVFGVGVRRRTS
jgi:hypothetical protein